MQKKGLLFIMLVLALFVFPIVEMMAQIIEFPRPGRYSTLEEIINGVITFALYVSLVLVPLMVLVGVFYIMTSAGDVNKVKTGQKFILYSTIGMALLLLSKGIIAIIRYLLLP